MKLTVIGGSAPSTPSLFDGDAAGGIPGLEVVLVGRDRARLAAVRRASESLARSAGCALACDVATFAELDSALDGSDVVLIQCRIGGLAARLHDETFPVRFGMCGDEGLGPGGLAAAIRTWPQLSSFLRSVERACPRAAVLLMTAPLGLLIRCARQEFPALRMWGVCELPWTTLTAACASAGVAPTQARFSYAGTNHLGWLYAIEAAGRDVVSTYAAAREGGTFPTGTFIHELRAIPLAYQRFHYQHAAELAAQTVRAPRAVELVELAGAAFEIYNDPGACAATLRSLLARRPTPWYRDAVAPLLAALAGHRDSKISFFLTTDNDGYLPMLPPDDIVERPFDWTDGALTSRPLGARPPAGISATLEGYIAYERIAARCVLEPDLQTVTRALEIHPWLEGRPVAELLAAEVLAGVEPECAVVA